MDAGIIRKLIYFFLAVIFASLFLMLVNQLGANRSPAPDLRTSGLAERALFEARKSMEQREAARPAFRNPVSTADVKGEGAIMIVGDRSFSGVAEAPKSVIATLTDMAEDRRRKVQPISLTDADLDKKVSVPSSGPKAAAKPVASAVPGMGEEAMGSLTLITAPVSFKVFKDSSSWTAFTSSHKGKFPEVDFATRQAVILVSNSDLPSGIFVITGISSANGETVVSYRVDPLRMSAESANPEFDLYAASAIPRGRPVKLKQVP